MQRQGGNGGYEWGGEIEGREEGRRKKRFGYTYPSNKGGDSKENGHRT